MEKEYLGGEIFKALLEEEKIKEKQNLYKAMITPIIRIIREGKTKIADLGMGIGTAEHFLFEELSKDTKLRLFVNDYDENLLAYGLGRISGWLEKKELTRVKVKASSSDLTEINLKEKVDGIILGSVLHELISAERFPKLLKGLKTIHDLLENNGIFSLYEFADLSKGESIRFKNIKFRNPIRKKEFQKDLKARLKKAMSNRLFFPEEYLFHFINGYIPKALFVDSLYGIAANQPPDHLHSMLFTGKELTDLLEQNGFEIVKIKEFKSRETLSKKAEKCGIVNIDETVKLLCPDRIIIEARKSEKFKAKH